MTVTLTHDAALSRVEIDADGLAAADYATIERSTDQIRWTTVRGAVALPVTAGALDDPHYDYEFKPNVANYYRVRGISEDPIAFVAAGASSTGSSGSRTPGLPAGMLDGDAVLIWASTRNSGTGTVDTPADWQLLASSGNAALLGRVYDGIWAMPTVTYTGGAANEDTIAQSAAWRNAGLPAATSSPQLNASAQDVAYPALNVPGDDHLILVAAWRQDDYTSAALASMTEIGESSSTAGNDASQVWYYSIQTDETDIAAGSVTITGGASAISRAITAAFAHAEYLNEQIEDVTPTLDEVWLKSAIRPFLNMAISLGGRDFEPERAGRGTTYGVQERSLPVGVSQLPGSKRYPLLIRTTTDEQAQQLDFLLASGDVLFLHAPANKVVPAGGVWVMADRSAERLLHVAGERRHWMVSVQEVAAPGPDVAYALFTWQTLLLGYGDLDALLADNATLDDLLQLIADPSEVIVE